LKNGEITMSEGEKFDKGGRIMAEGKTLENGDRTM
jgi:hypothetical protein